MKYFEFEKLVLLTKKAHEAVIQPEELQGFAPDKSLDSALARPFNKIEYGLTNNVYDHSADCCVAIVKAHAFNDANKRTALTVMAAILKVNGIKITSTQKELEDVLVNVSNDLMDESTLANWLASHSEAS